MKLKAALLITLCLPGIAHAADSSDLDTLQIVGLAVGLIISILLIIAVLQIPKIARYHRATMKLTALMAVKQGISRDRIEVIVTEGLNAPDSAFNLSESKKTMELENV